MKKIENIIRHNIILSTSIFILIFLFLLFFIQKTIRSKVRSNDKISINLSQSKWKFYSYDSNILINQSLNQYNKVKKNNKHLDALASDNTKIINIWYQSQFISKKNIEVDQILYLDKLFFIQKIYLNGKLIENNEGQYRTSIVASNKDQYFYVKKDDFIEGENLLSIKLKIDARHIKSANLNSDKYYFSKVNDFYTYYYRSYIGAFVIAFFIFIIGLYYLILYLRLKEIKENLFFSFYTFIAFLLLFTHLISSNIGVPEQYKDFVDIIHLFSEYSLNLFLILLLYSLYKISIGGKIFYGLVIIHSLLFITTIISSSSDVWFQMYYIFTIVYLLECLYMLYLVGFEIKKKNIENIALFVSMLFLVLTSVYYFILENNIFINIEYFAFSIFMVNISIAIILGNKYIYLFKKTEELNKNIENLVKERTEELQITLKKILERNVTQAKELNLARSIQNSLLPQEDLLSDFIKVMAYYSPMQDIGGDTYDYFYLDENKIVFILTDVSGHGVPAALIAVMLKMVFENHIDIDSSPLDVLKKVNDSMLKYLMSAEYFTGIYAILDTKTMVMTYASGGHPPMILLKKDEKEPIILQNTGGLIGFYEKFEIENKTIQLSQGDRLFFYTDGVTGALDEKENPYGFSRLIQVLNENKKVSLNETYNRIINSIYNHTDIKSIDDDITFLLIEVDKDYN